MKFIDLFSGIGGFRTGMEMNGHECVAFCEIDKYARQSYKAIYDTKGEEEWHDITQVSNDDFRSFRGRADVITGGFPCQAFSIAGKRRGFEDTRGTLFFEIARAIKEIQPSYALLENVKGLFSHDKGRTFGTIIQALDELGYVVEWGLFNSKYWGVPQNRERVFILATRKDVFRQPKLINLLNKQTEVNAKLIDVLESEVDEKYFLSEEKTGKMILNNDLSGTLNHFAFREVDKIHNTDGVSPTLSTMQGGNRQPKIAVPVLTPDRVNKRQNGRRFKEDGEPMFTLTAQDKHGVAIRAKDGMGRMGEQAIETFITNSCVPGDTINAYNRTVDKSGISPTLTTRPEGFKTAVLLITGEEQADVLGVGHHPFSKKREFNGYGDLSPTLIATDYKAPKTALMSDFRIRKLTPLECWRLQGFTDEQFYKAKNDGVSNSQLYKQAGNSVTVNVIDAIARKLQ